MKGFIEVTDYDGGMRVILPVDKITSIVCDKAKSVLSKWAWIIKAFRREYS